MNVDLTADSIIAAFDRLRGSFIDLDRSVVVKPDDVVRTSGALTSALRVSAGLKPGDMTLMAVGNGPMFLATLCAILEAGASPLLLHGDTPAAEIRRNAERFGATVVVTDSCRESDLSAAGFAGAEFSLAPWAEGSWARLQEPAPEQGGGDGRLLGVPLHPTSGTTGTPKLAVRPGACAISEARHYIDTIGVDERDVILCTVPMSHAYGYGMCAMVPLISGARVVTARHFSAVAALRAMNEHKVTLYPASPASLDSILIEAGESRPPRTRCITSAGAPLPERIAAEVQRRWGTNVRPLYGTTETGGISVATDDHDGRETGSVGAPMEGVSIKLLPFDEDKEAQDEGIGRLCVRSSSLMAGYLGGREIDRSCLVDGWFETGDLARIDHEGRIFLRGRNAEVINVFGLKVLPSEVEEVISLLPSVKEVKVYSVPNSWGSHTVSAAVVAEGIRDADVKAHCRRHLVAYKQPRRVVMLDRLPRSSAGKILVAELP